MLKVSHGCICATCCACKPSPALKTILQASVTTRMEGQQSLESVPRILQEDGQLQGTHKVIHLDVSLQLATILHVELLRTYPFLPLLVRAIVAVEDETRYVMSSSLPLLRIVAFRFSSHVHDPPSHYLLNLSTHIPRLSMIFLLSMILPHAVCCLLSAACFLVDRDGHVVHLSLSSGRFSVIFSQPIRKGRRI